MPSPDARFDSWWEVWTTFGGVMEESVSLQTYHDAFLKADALRTEFLRNHKPDDCFRIYITPHYCGQSEECNCAQYLDDHSAWYSSIR